MIIYTAENGEYQVLAEASQLIPEAPIDYNISGNSVAQANEQAEQLQKPAGDQSVNMNQKDQANADKNGK